MLTNNIRDHIITFADWSRINVTSTQAEFIEQEIQLKKHNEFIKIEDVDTQEILFNWRCNEIKRFEQRKSDPTLQNAWRWCGFWVFHPISNAWACECKKEFKTVPILFKSRIKSMWFEFDYEKQITEEMRLAYWRKFLNN